MANLAHSAVEEDRGRQGRDDIDPFDRLDILDPAQTRELSSLFDRSDFLSLMKMVKRCLTDEGEALRKANAWDQRDEMTRSAHKLVGMAGNYGIMKVSEKAARLEHDLKNDGCPKRIAEETKSLCEQIKGASREIDALLTVL